MGNKLEEARKIINEVDARMAELFLKRMGAAEMVFAHKKEYGLPILDQKREAQVIATNASCIEDETLREYYVAFLKNVMAVSRAYQYRLQQGLPAAENCAPGMYDTTIHMDLGPDSYDIVVERNLLEKAGQHLNLNRRVLIVTDTGVPAAYGQILAKQCRQSVICTVEAGEDSKSLPVFEKLLQTMLDNHFSRQDCVVALGGGVVGDLSGFAASAYMRGIDFYNIPTTLLSQIDSSIGGKTAINFGGVKNIVGAFYQPKKVLVDPDLLKTLPQRQIANGLAEAIKMALTSDRELFELIETRDIESNLEQIIIRSLNIKKMVVEQDEKEAGLRKILNFGHTIGHGIESSEGMTELYHGECVALGLIPMCAESIRQRVVAVLKKCNLYNIPEFHWEEITEAAFHDKKADGDTVTVTTVPEIGTFELKSMKCTEVIQLAKAYFERDTV